MPLKGVFGDITESCIKQALTLLSLLLIRMIEDHGQSGDNMADRRQLFVEMSKYSGLQLSMIFAGLFY